MDTRRFHNPQYKKQIQAVRTYKRQAARLPDGSWQKFLAAVGLGTWLRQVMFLLFVAAVTYLVYFAKFMEIKTIQVSGADGQQVAEINSHLRDYEKSYYYFLPQNNIVFFNAVKFKSYLLAHDYQISSVASIKRIFWGRLGVTVVQRVPAYVLQNKDNYFILNSDGNLSSQVQNNQENLPLITDSADEGLQQGESIFDEKKYMFLSSINSDLNKKIPAQIDHYEIPGIYSSDLIVYTKNGYKLYLDDTQDPQLYLGRLVTLWAQLSPDQQKKIVYIDMRFDPNVYVCYKGDKCDGTVNTPTNSGQALPYVPGPVQVIKP